MPSAWSISSTAASSKTRGAPASARTSASSPRAASDSPAETCMLRDDVGSAVRALRARPGFAALVVACLAIGIGANIAMFSIANVLFLRPPTGVRNADALLRLYVIRRSGETRTPVGGPFSYPDFADLRHTPHAFAGLAASTPETF